MAPPNVLLPDPNTRTIQLLNWPPRRLLQYQIGRIGWLIALVVVPAAVLTFTDGTDPLRALGSKTSAFCQALVLMLGAAADSFAYFATLGPRSQAWQEGQAGQWYGRAVEEKGQGVNLPRGLVPALFATTRCFTVSLGTILLSAAGAEAGRPVLVWAPGLLLVGWALFRLWRHHRTYDRHFYQTTAFYEEVMGDPGSIRDRGREPVPVEALYWVPPRWRPAVWASLRQLDRRLPLGRLVGLAHLGLWLLCLRGVSWGVVAGYLVVLLVGQTAACAFLTTPTTAPLAFQRTVQSLFDWIATRTFVNLRWLPAHVGSFALVALFSDVYGGAWIGLWLSVHIALSFGAAVATTSMYEARARWRSA